MAVVNPQNPFDSGFQQYRNYLIHRLMFNYGLRVGEVQLLLKDCVGPTLPDNSYQRIFYNMLLLTIICSFRFQEIMLLKMTSLVKREITDKEKRQHGIDQDWPTYRLGSEYLGAKKAGWRIHWLAPSTYSVVVMIYKSVQELTLGFRKTIQGFRDSR